MPFDERSARLDHIKRIVRENDIEKWMNAQQTDIAAKRSHDHGQRSDTTGMHHG
jgi:trehalose-6-phosphate synthase